jgi:hypothetical protein
MELLLVYVIFMDVSLNNFVMNLVCLPIYTEDLQQ